MYKFSAAKLVAILVYFSHFWIFFFKNLIVLLLNIVAGFVEYSSWSLTDETTCNKKYTLSLVGHFLGL